MARTEANDARQKIGRQIVLPFSKAFEIAWKGIQIRIWRSLITMSGIILAIAFLMSVWTNGVFDKALRSVGEGDERYALVQGAREAEAIASGGVRIRCVVVEEHPPGQSARITAGTGIRTTLNAQDAFSAEAVPADPASLTEVLSAGGEADVNALITIGLPAVLAEPEVANSVRRFVRAGGMLLIYGTHGLEEGEPPPLQDLLPALPAQGTVGASGATITRAPQAVQVGWQEHPPAEFARMKGKPNATALASVDGDGIAWTWSVQKGTVWWYPVADSSSEDTDVILWFAQAHTTAAVQEGAYSGPSLLLGALARGVGTTGERRDMRGIWLVTLSLMVCVVGITNAMLMSVTERFREIGTMKCLGALDKFVVKLFLIESSLQGVVGSVAGAIIGFALAFVRSLLTFHVRDLETGRSYWLVLDFFPVASLVVWAGIALGVGIVLSVIAAIYPAIRAARMQPVQAMRAEA